MVTRQRSPSFFLRYQALIRPPGPPPTIARSNMCFPRSPAALWRASGLSHPTKSAFYPEGKMNKRSSKARPAKNSKKGRLSPALFTSCIRAALFHGRQRQRFDFGSRGHDRRLLLALVENQLVALDRDFADFGHRGSGARRDQPADNDVLLEAFQRVHLAVDGGFGEHAGGLLERGRREERAGLQARPGY